MKKSLLKSLLLTAGMALLMTACGGGGSDTATTSGSSITTSGAITGFGSIYVNGVRFDTQSSDISLDDVPGSESDLALGMIVTVNGTVDDSGSNGVAESISFDDSIEGPIAGPISLDADGQSKMFTILGQTVVVDRNTTVYDDTTFDTLAVDDVIEVSGFVGTNSEIVATRVEGQGSFNGSTSVELKGDISNLDTTARSFDIGAASIVYDTSTSFDDMTEADLKDGLYVEVEGTYDGNVVLASEIEREDEGFDSDSDSDKASIEGLITEYVSDSSFKVQGQPVDASSAEFEPASLVLADGLQVEVEGPIDADGVLQAVEVEARSGDYEFATVVDSVDTLNGIVVLAYTNANGGIDTVSIQVMSSTVLEDDTNDDDSSNGSLTLDQLLPGDFVEVEARDDGNGNLVATELERDDGDDRVIQAPLDADAIQDVPGSKDGSLTVLGIAFNTSSTVDSDGTDFEGLSDDDISADAFFAAAVQGQLVKVKDNGTGDGIADEVELED